VALEEGTQQQQQQQQQQRSSWAEPLREKLTFPFGFEEEGNAEG
jgi:hypothetical protein